MRPKFSIIIPVYNVAPWLRECLDSMLAQTCRDWECICVDDGSTDGSGVILDECEKKVEKLGGCYQRKFNVIHQKNAGVSAARNAALGIARGEWVAFLDADDVWNSNLLELCQKVIEHNSNLDIVGFGFCRGVSKFKFGQLESKCDCYDGKEVTQAFTPYFWSRIYRRALLEEIRFQDYTIGEDILFQTEALVRARKVVVLSNLLYGYRERSGSAILSVLSERKVFDRIGYLSAVIHILLRSGKRVPSSLLRICVNGLTEGFANEYFRLELNSRLSVQNAWIKSVNNLSGIGLFQSVRLFLLRHLPFDVGMKLLCLWPYRLKVGGFRRGGVK